MSVRALMLKQQQQQGSSSRGGRNNMRETIHSGHFMVSDFEPESEAQDEEYEVGMPIPPGPPETVVVKAPVEPLKSSSPYSSSSHHHHHPHHQSSSHPYSYSPLISGGGGGGGGGGSSSVGGGSSARGGSSGGGGAYGSSGGSSGGGGGGGNVKRDRNGLSSLMSNQTEIHHNQLMVNNRGGGQDEDGTTAISIDGSLTKLFNCMSLAYRQKLTSPKWNRFKGVRLRWKDKIRLNNVIWRCWHMQFIMKKKTLVCQFASPLDVDGHNKPEAVVMEGKYWKRKLSTVAAEYKKWRLFYRNRIMGWSHTQPPVDLHPVSLDGFDWSRSGTFGTMSNIIFDDDIFMDFTDTLFSSLSSNQPFAFPNPKEIARVGMVADFIQPGLIQLQPNLDDFMDTLEPLHDYVNSKLLPPVPEELENFDPPDNLLSDGLLTHHNNNSGKGHGHQTFYDQGLILQSQQQNGISHHHHQQQQQHQQQEQQHSIKQQGHGQGGRQGQHQQQLQQSDIFAKPQVIKTKGRSRSGGGGQGNRGPSHQQQLVNNANSTTLLSHLLSGSNSNSNTLAALAPATSGVDFGVGGGGPLNMILGEQFNQSPFHLPPTSTNTPVVINFVGMSGKSSLLSSLGASSTPAPNTSPTSASSPGGGGGSRRSSVSPPNAPPPIQTTSNSLGHLSPTKSLRKSGSTSEGPGELRGSGGGYKEHRRVCHINAEQKRRCNIKNGFDTLHSLIPQLSHNPNAKVSKAAMLAKGAEYIRQLKSERSQLKDDIEAHRSEVEALNSAINNCQSMLPATGAPVSRQRTSRMNEMFHEWVRARTMDNWKFWLFSTLIRPLLDSYNSSVSTASVDEMCRTVLAWVDQHCSLVDLRPAVLTSLRQLCTSTDILSNPGKLQEEAYKAVNRPFQQQDDRGGGNGDSSR